MNLPIGDQRQAALLLLGPTGAGKTPLGEQIATHGLWGHRFLHFDFGRELRQAVATGSGGADLEPCDQALLEEVLRSGRLLEDGEFYLAQRVFRSFVERYESDRFAAADRIVVLNGLPRHLGQAEAMASWVTVEAVVCLECTAEVVVKRLQTNAGGDRQHRSDDDLGIVGRKLAWYRERTVPLVDFYRQRGARVRVVDVTSQMTASDMWARLNAAV